MTNIFESIDNATVGTDGNAVLLGSSAFGMLNASLPAIKRITSDDMLDAHLIVPFRGVNKYCIRDEGAAPYSVVAHNVAT